MKASAKPVFVLATAQPSTQHLECDEVDIPTSVMLLFKGVSRLIEPASEFARKHFFAPLFSERSVMVRVEKESSKSIIHSTMIMLAMNLDYKLNFVLHFIRV